MNKDLVASVLKSEFKFGDKRLDRFFSAMNEVAATAQAVASTPKQTRILKNDYHVRKRWVERVWNEIMHEKSMKVYVEENKAKIDSEIDKCFARSIFLYSKPYDRGKMFQSTVRGYYVNLEERMFFVSDEKSNMKVTTYRLKMDVPEILADQMVGGVCASIVSLREEVQAIRTDQAKQEEQCDAEVRSIREQVRTLQRRESEVLKKLHEVRIESPKITSIYDQMNSLTAFLTSKGRD